MYRPPREKSPTLDERLGRKLSRTKTELSLDNFYYAAFDLHGSYSNLKDEYLLEYNDKSKWDIIKKIISVYDITDKSKMNTEIEMIRDKTNKKDIFNKSAEAEILYQINEKSVTYFLLLLSKRRLALALLLVFNYSEQEAYKVLTNSSKSASESTLKALFSTRLFMIGQDKDSKGTQDKKTAMKNLLSQKDEDFLMNIAKAMKAKDSSFSCKILT